MSEMCSKCGVCTRGGACETYKEAAQCPNYDGPYKYDLSMQDISNETIAGHLRYLLRVRRLTDEEQAILLEAAIVLEKH